MPNYRNGEYESRRKPLYYEQERKNQYKPEWVDDEYMKERKLIMKPIPTKFFFPFQVEVRVIPRDDRANLKH